jgi:hypothetical protein
MRMHASSPTQRGHAIAETLVALLALSPFIVGLPLLGKQLDIKHKSLDAARYAVWERSVWQSDGAANRKTPEEILLEARDRTLGDPQVGVVAVDQLYASGVTENRFWLDRSRERLIDYRNNRAPIALALEQRAASTEIGQFFVPGLAHGEGALAAAVQVLQVEHLGLRRRALAHADISIGVRPLLSERAQTKTTLGARERMEAEIPSLTHRARGALLSDTWSARDEDEFRTRVDRVTPNEALAALELPARAIGVNALGKGRMLYGEGQFAWEPELRPYSSTLPAAFLRRR